MKKTFDQNPPKADLHDSRLLLLEDAMGGIDDDLIQAVDQLRQQRDGIGSAASLEDPSTVDAPSRLTRLRPVSWRKVAAWGSLAACLCLFVGVRSLWSLKAADSAPAEAIKDASDSYFSGHGTVRDDMDIVSENQSTPSSATKEETRPAMTYVLPSLYLHTEDQVVPALNGAHSWSISREDGFIMQVQSESYHPLELQDSLPVIQTSVATLLLTFDDIYGTPETISAQCWDDTCWGDPTALSRSIPVDGHQITLLEGPYIYQITTRWEEGTIQYCFYANYDPYK